MKLNSNYLGKLNPNNAISISRMLFELICFKKTFPFLRNKMKMNIRLENGSRGELLYYRYYITRHIDVF